jgi:CHAT domain-containing protein
MVKFHELWNPVEGADRFSAAAALRQAQEHVRGTDAWSAPQYWAAWQLWGLPD